MEGATTTKTIEFLNKKTGERTTSQQTVALKPEWEARVAQKYYARLYKEYVIGDLEGK